MSRSGGGLPVLFVVGAGASGSTLLDTILGNHPRIGSYGELARLPGSGWGANGLCACGEAVGSCPFWSEVRERWLGPHGRRGLEEYLALDRRFLRVSRWNRLRAELGREGPEFRVYLERTASLLETVRRVDGVEWIVDSSKRAARALVLARTPGVDLHVLHIVRDSRAVAWSLRRRESAEGSVGRPGRSTSSAAAFWLRRNLAAEVVRRRVPGHRFRRVRYEDLVSDPERVLTEVGEMAGLVMGDLARDLRRGAELEVGHTFPGERLRRRMPVRLNPDMEWTRRMPSRDRELCWTLTCWLLRTYGYRSPVGDGPQGRVDR